MKDFTNLHKRIMNTALAVTMAAVLCMIPVLSAGYKTSGSTVDNGSNTVSKAAAANAASNYTQDEALAKRVDEIANSDINEVINSQFELIPLEELNIVEDTSAEDEVMGGKKDNVDKGGYKSTVSAGYTEVPGYLYGVDVSKWQGDINWQAARAGGISFAMIKCAGRSTGLDGSLYIDPYFEKNIQAAQAAGVQCGVYFFSQALNVMEAFEEACATVQLCQKYNITYPIAFDWESADGYRVSYYPQDKLTMNIIAATFCNTVASYGYTPMIYANKSDFYNVYDANALSASYKIWLANYYPEYNHTNRIYLFEKAMPATSFPYQMWQFGVASGIAGFSGYVDMDLGFFYYMPTLGSRFQLSVASNTLVTTVGNRLNLLDGVTAISSAGINAIGYVIYSIVDANGTLVTEDYAFANVGIYAVTYGLTDVDGTTDSKRVLLYVYPPNGV